jgi:hypothetical protein
MAKRSPLGGVPTTHMSRRPAWAHSSATVRHRFTLSLPTTYGWGSPAFRLERTRFACVSARAPSDYRIRYVDLGQLIVESDQSSCRGVVPILLR